MSRSDLAVHDLYMLLAAEGPGPNVSSSPLQAIVCAVRLALICLCRICSRFQHLPYARIQERWSGVWEISSKIANIAGVRMPLASGTHAVHDSPVRQRCPGCLGGVLPAPPACASSRHHCLPLQGHLRLPSRGPAAISRQSEFCKCIIGSWEGHNYRV